MASHSIALKHWSRIIAKWPVDKVRPEAVSFQTLMQKRLDRIQNPHNAVADQTKVKGNAANVQPIDLSWNEARELKQVNALQAFLENRFQKEAPLPDNLRFPACNPSHYDAVITESERAPERGLMTKITNKLRGMIRLR